MFTNKTFWKDTLERAIKTFAQSLVAVGLSGATGVLDVDWVNALSVALLATLVSVFTSIGSGTVGDDSASVLKLQEKESSSGDMANSRFISLSGSTPRLRSMVIFRPSKPVSSRMSAISFTLPCFTRSMTRSTITSMVVVGGICVTSMQFWDLS